MVGPLAGQDGPSLLLAVLPGAAFGDDPAALRFRIATSLLYGADATGWLAFARIAMGTPLLALALLVAFWAFRRSTRRLVRRG